MAGRNLQSIAEIGTTLAKVRTDLGLTGEVAERETERFLRYAEATGQTAPDAVLAFDDVLDAWGLTAEDSAGIMDMLIESHQRYGGSITDNQRLLAGLAPTLQAANLDLEDANGLLNLFARAGVGAEAAQTAFTRALGQVGSPEELQSAPRRHQRHRGPLPASAEGGRPVRRPSGHEARPGPERRGR